MRGCKLRQFYLEREKLPREQNAISRLMGLIYEAVCKHSVGPRNSPEPVVIQATSTMPE